MNKDVIGGRKMKEKYDHTPQQETRHGKSSPRKKHSQGRYDRQELYPHKNKDKQNSSQEGSSSLVSMKVQRRKDAHRNSETELREGYK